MLLEVDTQTSLESVLCEVRQSKTKIDAVVAIGDLAQRPKKDIYERFFRLVSKSPDIQFGFKTVKTFIFGHVLQELYSCFQGILALGRPSTCFQFCPHTSTFALNSETPGCRILRLGNKLDSEVYRFNFTVQPMVKSL